MSDPRPEEFAQFDRLLRKEAPDGYTPHYFRCRQGGKAPDTSYGSWKADNARLTTDEAIAWLESGGNVGVAGMEDDRLVNVDIDDEDETSLDDLKTTLVSRSRSRTGGHGFYFAEPGEDIPNIPTDDAGEVRTDGQFVVAPGSYVAVDGLDTVPEDEQEDAGYYTVEQRNPAASITFDELPAVFREIHERNEKLREQAEREHEDFDIPDTPDGRSAVFDVSASDVTAKEGGSIDANDRWSSVFHGSDTDENMALTSKGRLQCFRHNVAHGGLQALVVMSDYIASGDRACERVGTPHSNSGGSPSCIVGDDEAIWCAWKYAKQNGYIPDDDPVPYRALLYLVRDMGVAPESEIPDSYDPDNDERLPDYAYDAALSGIEGRWRLDSGREKVGQGGSQEPQESVFAEEDGENGDGSGDDGGVSDDDETEDTDDEGTSGTDNDGSDEDADNGNVWDEIRDLYRGADDAEEKRLPRHDAGRQLQNEYHFATHEDTDGIWVFNDDNGLYEERGESVVRQRLVNKLAELYAQHEKREILDQLRGRTTERQDAFGGSDGLLCLSNGVLDIDDPNTTRTLLDHSPDEIFMTQSPVEYDPQAGCPRWREFLKESVNTEAERMKLQEYVGYCLMNWALPYHKAVFLVGPAASGKSTFLDTVNAMLGDAVTSLTPQQMVDEQFASHQLYGAWANISNEIPTELIRNTGAFKEILAGDEIKAEQKFQDPFFFNPTAKHLFAANQLPDADVDDNAFYRRIILIPFPTSVPREKRDPALSEKLKAELPGILNWALDGLDRLREQHRFTAERTPGETRETWEAWGSTVDRFKQRCIEYVPDGKVAKSDLYDIYLRYCEEEGIPAETQNKLTRTLKQDSKIADGRATVDGRQRRVYTGIELNEDRLPAVKSEESSSDGTGVDLGRFDG